MGIQHSREWATLKKFGFKLEELRKDLQSLKSIENDQLLFRVRLEKIECRSLSLKKFVV